MKLKLLIGIAALLAMVNGCAYMKSNTHSTTHYLKDGSKVVEEDTHARAFTFFDANSSLTKFANGSSASTRGTNVYSPGTYASGINEASSGSNVVNGVSQIVAAGVQAFVQSAK